MHEIFEDLKDAVFGNERQADFSQFAKRYGLAYQKKRPIKEIDYDLRDTNIFKGKKRKTIRNFCSQNIPSIGGKLQLFDYTHFPDSGKKQTTVVLFETAEFNFPAFLLRPKRTIEKLGSLFKRSKVEFHENPLFNEAYIFSSAAKDRVKPLIQKAILDLLISENHLSVEGKGPYLMIYEKNKLQPMEKLLTFYEDAIEIADLFHREPPGEFV